MDLEFQFCKMKRVTEIGCAMMSMYLTLQNCTVKNGYNGKFYVMCVFPQWLISIQIASCSSSTNTVKPLCIKLLITTPLPCIPMYAYTHHSNWNNLLAISDLYTLNPNPLVPWIWPSIWPSFFSGISEPWVRGNAVCVLVTLRKKTVFIKVTRIPPPPSPQNPRAKRSLKYAQFLEATIQRRQ